MTDIFRGKTMASVLVMALIMVKQWRYSW